MSSSDPNNAQEQAQAQLQQQIAEHQKSLGQIVSAGHEAYGEVEFDAMSSDVANYIGADKMPEFGFALAATDHPAALVDYLANHPDEARAIGKMSGPRKTVALERIQSRIRPNASFEQPSAVPSWKRSAAAHARGTVDEQLLDDSISDERFFKLWKKKNGMR